MLVYVQFVFSSNNSNFVTVKYTELFMKLMRNSYLFDG